MEIFLIIIALAFGFTSYKYYKKYKNLENTLTDVNLQILEEQTKHRDIKNNLEKRLQLLVKVNEDLTQQLKTKEEIPTPVVIEPIVEVKSNNRKQRKTTKS